MEAVTRRTLADTGNIPERHNTSSTYWKAQLTSLPRYSERMDPKLLRKSVPPSQYERRIELSI